jgi:hypothetical protein
LNYKRRAKNSFAARVLYSFAGSFVISLSGFAFASFHKEQPTFVRQRAAFSSAASFCQAR